MRAARSGNSVAVGLPAAVVEALRLMQGDEIDIHVEGRREFAVARKPGRGRLPPDFKFDGDAANDR
jgi:antitoxin MazE